MFSAICLSGFLNFLQSAIFTVGYISGSQLFPEPLTSEEEHECLEKLANGDEDARNILIEKNLRLVAHVCKKYSNSNVDQDDLISIGTIGLIKAVSTFDYTNGAKFATYASRCIENEILMSFRSAKKTASDVYINEPVEFDKDGNAVTLMDLIDDGVDIHEQVDLLIRSRQLYQFLDKCLDERELEIIIYRYGLYGKSPHTQNETSKKLNISRSYVSRLEKKAIEKLKKMYDTTPF